MEEILRMEHITKRFGDVLANRDINLNVRRGEVHTLLGENGAGKSTLMNVLVGLYQPTEGEIFLGGKRVRIDSPARAVQLGISVADMDLLTIGMIQDMYTEALNDQEPYAIVATQEHFDAF